MEESSAIRRKKFKENAFTRIQTITEEHHTTCEDTTEEKSIFFRVANEKEANSKGKMSHPNQMKRRLFQGSLKFSKSKWTSVDEKLVKKKRGLRSGMSMDDELLGKRVGRPCKLSPATKGDAVDGGIEFDSLFEEMSLESFKDTTRRGSICEEMEKEMFHEGLSLHKMRKTMVIQETLRDRFLM